MIANLVFSKSAEKLHSISKHETEKWNKNVAKCCTRNPNLKLVLKAGKFPDVRQKARQITWLFKFYIGYHCQ